MIVNKAILNNVNVSKVNSYLRNRNIKQNEESKGMETYLYLGKIIDDNEGLAEDINNVLFDDLMFGQRRLMRCYELKSIRKIKRETDWSEFLKLFECDNLNFNKILQTNLTTDQKLKIAAVRCTKRNDLIENINILFVYYMQILNTNGTITYSYSYLPVSINLLNKTLIIKVWNKELAVEGDTPVDQLDKVYDALSSKLEFTTAPISAEPQKVLYRMSNDLFDEFFQQLPNIQDIEDKKECIGDIVNTLLENITLTNTVIADGKLSMNLEVIDVKDEMYKLLQQVALYDYLKDNSLDTLLTNTDKVIARIRFNDRDNLSASLTSESGVKCIFDTKTFMCVRNSLDIVENIVSIVVTFNRDRGQLTVKYDASDSRFLNIHILKNLNYTEEDYNLIWELYNKYEAEDNSVSNAICVENDAQAM
jgi:hypothetical protein